MGTHARAGLAALLAFSGLLAAVHFGQGDGADASPVPKGPPPAETPARPPTPAGSNLSSPTAPTTPPPPAHPNTRGMADAVLNAVKAS